MRLPMDAVDRPKERALLCLLLWAKGFPVTAENLSTALHVIAETPDEEIAIKTLLLADLVDSTGIVEQLGDRKAAAVLARYDRIARDLLCRNNGREIDKTDGFLLLFDRPIDATRFALEFHEALRIFSEQCGIAVQVRIGIHLGEVIMRKNRQEDIARGAKPLEVEGLSKSIAARLALLAQPNQTLLTQTAYQLAHRAAVGDPISAQSLHWLMHGSYAFKGIGEPVEVYEVGLPHIAPLTSPEDSEKAKRIA